MHGSRALMMCTVIYDAAQESTGKAFAAHRYKLAMPESLVLILAVPYLQPPNGYGTCQVTGRHLFI